MTTGRNQRIRPVPSSPPCIDSRAELTSANPENTFQLSQDDWEDWAASPNSENSSPEISDQQISDNGPENELAGFAERETIADSRNLEQASGLVDSTASSDDWLEQWASPQSPELQSDGSRPDSELGRDSLVLPTIPAWIDEAKAVSSEPIRPTAGNGETTQSDWNQSASNEEFFFGEAGLASDSPAASEAELSGPTVVLAELQASQQVGQIDSSDSDQVSNQLPSWWNDEATEQTDSAQPEAEMTEQITPSDETLFLQPTSGDGLAEQIPALDRPSDADELYSEGKVVDGSAQCPAAAKGDSAPSEEGCVEQYMQELLARMRRTSEELPAQQTSQFDPPVPGGLAAQVPQEISLGNYSSSAVATTEPMDWDSYISLTKAPEKAKNIDLLRDLANSSARNAIHHSARRRHLTGGLIKLTICLTGMVVATVLYSINGLTPNLGLIATLASLLVAAIWGYDGLASLKPLLQSSLILEPPQQEESQAASQEASQSGNQGASQSGSLGGSSEGATGQVDEIVGFGEVSGGGDGDQAERRPVD
jgi:hypothetical protein